MRLIDADELLTAFPVDDEPTLTKSCVRMTIQHMPTVDAVPVAAYEQVRWERDIAVGQLGKLGYTLGEKVTPIVRCKDCKYVGTDATCCLVCKREGMGLRPFHVYHDDYCSYGEQKDGDGNG